MRPDQPMDKPYTLAEWSLRFRAATAGLGAAMLSYSRRTAEAAGAMQAWADAQCVEQFRLRCSIIDVDPEPSLARIQGSPLPLDDALTVEWQRLVREVFELAPSTSKDTEHE